MSEKMSRVIAFTVVLLMLVSFLPAGIIPTSSAIEIERQTDIGKSLDYTALHRQAYIVNPEWSNAAAGDPVSYIFRGTEYADIYDPSRHFSSFAAAYAYFESLYTDESGSISPDMAKTTPVFILSAGKYTESNFTVRYSAVILGSNAGVSPNSNVNLDTLNPTGGWKENYIRNNETSLNSGFLRTTRVNNSSTDIKYSKAAGSDDFELIIDGISFSGTANFVTLSDANGTAARNENVTVQNCILTPSKSSSYIINDTQSKINVNNYDFKNIRMQNATTAGFYSAYAANVRMDGVYCENIKGYITPTAQLNSKSFSFLMQNSYIYKCSVNYYNLCFRYANTNTVSTITFNHNIMYEITNAQYGMMMFYTNPTTGRGHYEVNVLHNTVIADKSLNSADKVTFLNGNESYQLGAYTLNVNYNRIIGYNSMFPNFSGDTSRNNHIKADFNYNYFAPRFESVDDVLGTRSVYANTYNHNGGILSHPYVDPADSDNLIYYMDYRMSIYEGMLDINGVSFYDDADYVSIDNANSTVTASYTCGKTIQNPKLYFKNPSVTGEFYSDSDLKNKITSIAAPAIGKTVTVYAKIGVGNTVKAVTVTLYGGEAVPVFADSFSDGVGVISKTAYLLTPAAAGVSNGKSITCSWDGTVYIFTVGTNAFSNLSDIFAKAGSKKPQILIPYGNAGSLNVTAPCEIYGENYKGPAVSGSGVYDWGTGVAWSSGKSAVVSGITVSCADVTISGIELTGKFSDTTRKTSGKITFKNSVVNSTNTSIPGYRQFNVSNNAVTNAANEYELSGVYFKSTSRDGGRHILFGGSLPSRLTVIGCYSQDAVTQLFDGQWNSSLYATECEVSVENSRFDGVEQAFLTDARSGLYSNGENLKYTVKNNAFMSDSLTDGALFTLSAGSYSSLEITDNIFVNTSNGKLRVLECDYKSSDICTVSFRENRIVGFSNEFDAVNLNGTDSVIDVSYNYFAAYNEDYTDRADGICPAGAARCTEYYGDYACTSLCKPISVTFNRKNNMYVDDNARLLELRVGFDTETLNFADGYVNNPNGNDIVLSYAETGNTADISAISVTTPITTVYITVSARGNPYIYTCYTLKIVRDIPDSLKLNYISSDKGNIIYDELTGSYTLQLHETSSGAKLTTECAPGSEVTLLENGVPAEIENIAHGECRDYILRVSCGEISADYRLRVLREQSSGFMLDYEAAVRDAYIISSEFSGVTDGNVSFKFRNKSYTQPYDENRHFADFDSAYAHWYANCTDIINDTPVFILTAGNYDNITVNFRAIILGANAGIDPSDRTADISELTPADDIPENPQRDTANETVITGAVRRTTRINGNNDLRLESALRTAENNADRRMRFLAVIDGVTFTGTGAKLVSLDIDAKSDGSVIGRRVNEMYVQNFRVTDLSNGMLYSSNDKSLNSNSVVVQNMRMTNSSAAHLFEKYADSIVLDGAYITSSTLTESILALGSNMSALHDVDYTFKNSFFKNNKFTRFLRVNGTADSSGTNSRTDVSVINNVFIESANAQWGLISAASVTDNVTFEVKDNLISQTGSYNNVILKTVLEGNPAFYVKPMTYRVNGNRFIGCTTYLPNMNSVTDDILSTLDFDFDGNYLSDVFESTADVTGRAPEYINKPSGDVDPIGPQELMYYFDYGKQVKNTDLELTGIRFNGIDAQCAIDNVNRTVNAAIFSNTTAQLQFFTRGGGVSKTLYRKGEDIPITAVTFKNVMTGDNDFTVVLSKNGVSISYCLKLTAFEAKDFASEFSDPQGIIGKTAFILDPAFEKFRDGDTVISSFNGIYYSFKYGQNAFSDIHSLKTMRDGHLQILIPDTYIDELIVPKDTEVFGLNYKTDPNVKGENLGDDWTRNPDWGKYGESCVKNIVISGDATGSDVTVRGITMRGRFYDGLREDSSKPTSVTLENIMVDHTEYIGTSPYGYYSDVYTFTFSNPANVSGKYNRDVGVLRNIRVESVKCRTSSEDITAGRNRLINEYLPQSFTVDGMYCDFAASGVSLIGWLKMSRNIGSAELTFENCNFRNGLSTTTGGYFNFEARDHANNAPGQSAVLNIRNNSFFDIQQCGYAASFSIYGYSRINITDNLFLSKQVPSAQTLLFKDAGTHNGIDGILNITRNRFVGTQGKITNPDNNAAADISGNYFADYTDDFTNGKNGKAMGGTNVLCDWYYTDYAATLRSDALGGYMFGNGCQADYGSKNLYVSVESGKPFSLQSYIVYNNGNTVTVDGYDDITALAADDGAQYTVRVSKGGKSEVWTLNVAVSDVDMSALKAALDAAQICADDDTLRENVRRNAADLVLAGKKMLEMRTAASDEAAELTARLELAVKLAQMSQKLDKLIAEVESYSIFALPEPHKSTVGSLLETARQVATADSGEQELNNAYLRLERAVSRVTFDREAFKAQIDSIQQFIDSGDTEYYDRTGVFMLKNVLAQAKSAYNDENAGVFELYDVKGKLDNAFSGLTANTAKLLNEIKYAKDDLKKAAGKCTEKSIAALSAEIDRAQALENPTGNDVKLAVLALRSARAGLVDKSAYDSAMKNARAITNDGRFSDQSWQAFVDELDRIESGAAGFETADDVEKACDAIEKAFDLLTNDMSELSRAIIRAQAVDPADWSVKSYAALKAALENALALSDDAPQSEIDAVLAAINKAFADSVDIREFNLRLAQAKAISNNGEYCPATFDALTAAVLQAEAAAAEFDSADDVAYQIQKLEDAMSGLSDHVWGEYVYNDDATCVTGGTMTAKCEHCDATDTKDDPSHPATGIHTWGEYVYNNDADCGHAGTMTAKCDNCDATDTKDDPNHPATGNHTWGEYVYNNDAACETNGTMTAKCTKCDATDTKADPAHPALGHDFGEYVYNNDATTEKDGTKTAKCSRCDKTDTVTAEGTKLAPTVVPVKSAEKFSDIKSGAWYEQYTDYVATYGLMNGMSATTFEPTSNLTRAMFVQILANLEGVDTTDKTAATIFEDVPAGKWYTPAVKWANENGIVDGIKATIFNPMGNIQRQQMCVMLVRYAKYKGITLKADVATAKFADDANIQDYAKDAVYACQAAGIVNGKTPTTFEPRANATRAEVAKIITVFHKDYVAK